MGSIEKFVKRLEDYDREQLKLPVSQRNIMDTGTSAQMAFDCMIECFLGEDWYSYANVTNAQVNTEACHRILWEHSRKFRKLIRLARKRLDQEVRDGKTC